MATTRRVRRAAPAPDPGPGGLSTAALDAAILASWSEDQWAEQVVAWARRGGWCGYHVRRSDRVSQGVHTLRTHGDHDDGRGLPDWLFWKDLPGLYLAPWLGVGGFLMAELKTVRGVLSADQRRTTRALMLAGVRVKVWRPTDADDVLDTFGLDRETHLPIAAEPLKRPSNLTPETSASGVDSLGSAWMGLD